MKTQPLPPYPFHFDGHGINDATGQRLCKVTHPAAWIDDLEHPGRQKRNPEHIQLAQLFRAAPLMLDAITLSREDLANVRLFLEDPDMSPSQRIAAALKYLDEAPQAIRSRRAVEAVKVTLEAGQ